MNDAADIQSDPVAMPHRMAPGAQSLVQGLPGLRCKVEIQRLGVGARYPRLRTPLGVHATHRQCQAVEVAKDMAACAGRKSYPLAVTFM